ncbi:MAG: sigma-70 family RNA polymerase sigma factor [Pirellulaceae bacterium]
MNNDEFVQGLRNHDPEAAKHLHECYVPAVWRFAYFRVNGDEHLAEDIVSDSVLALVAAIDKGDEIEFPSAWLRSVATRRIQDHYRAAARVAHLMNQAGAEATGETTETPATKHADKMRRQEIRDVLDQMPEQYRMVLEWKYADNASVREIASRMDVTEKAAESLLFRARKVFRDQMTRCNNEAQGDNEMFSEEPAASESTSESTSAKAKSYRAIPVDEVDAPNTRPGSTGTDQTPRAELGTQLGSGAEPGANGVAANSLQSEVMRNRL